MKFSLFFITIATTVLALVSGLPAEAQSSPPVSCPELEALVASVDELVAALTASLDRQGHHQEMLIAIQYLQFRSRSIESLEEEVRRTEDLVSSARDRADRVKGEVQTMEQQLSDSPPEEVTAMTAAINRYRRMADSEEDRIDRYERQIIDMENRILDSRRQLLALEEFLSENLDLGQ